jgi:hypothetical protein
VATRRQALHVIEIGRKSNILYPSCLVPIPTAQVEVFSYNPPSIIVNSVFTYYYYCTIAVLLQIKT